MEHFIVRKVDEHGVPGNHFIATMNDLIRLFKMSTAGRANTWIIEKTSYTGSEVKTKNDDLCDASEVDID